MSGILIDITRLVDRFIQKRLPTGVDRVSLAYVGHYGAQARAVLRYRSGKFVFRRAESDQLFDWLLRLGTGGSPLPLIFKGLVLGCLVQRVAGDHLFNTGHSGLESDDYIAMLRHQGVRPVLVVYDLIPITHPQFCRAGEPERHFSRLRNVARIASGVVCISQATQTDLQRLCDHNRWTMPPCVVGLLAPALPKSQHQQRPVARPYFVFVSTIEPRKNHLMILRVWHKLKATMGDAAPQLVIIGQRGWHYEAVSEMLDRPESFDGLVTELSTCSDVQLVTYLEHAQALLFPSFTEGYGMPVVEALAHGLPVIASDLAVFREFAGEIPEYLDASDEASWADTIAAYTPHGSPARQRQLLRLEGYVAPSWDRHFEQVDRLLRDATQGHAAGG